MKRNSILAMIIALMISQSIMADECDSYCNTNDFSDCLCDPCSSWSFDVDWIWWKVRRYGLDYAVVGKGNVSIDFATEELPQGKTHYIEPDRDSGFRIAFFKGCDCWDLGIRYTHFKTNETEKLNRLAETDIFATRAQSSGDIANPGLVDLATSKYAIDLNMIDLEFGYRVDFECFDGNVRPFTGAKITYIDQSMKTIYELINASEIQDNLIEEKLDFDAYGLYCGLEGQLEDVWCKVGFFGRTSVAISLANIESQFLQYDFDGLEIQNLEVQAKNDKWCIIPYYEVAFGLQYDVCDFLCVDWSVQLGYEFHQWCDMEDFINFISTKKISRDKANLGIDGLFLRFCGSY